MKNKMKGSITNLTNLELSLLTITLLVPNILKSRRRGGESIALGIVLTTNKASITNNPGITSWDIRAILYLLDCRNRFKNIAYQRWNKRVIPVFFSDNSEGGSRSCMLCDLHEASNSFSGRIPGKLTL